MYYYIQSDLNLWTVGCSEGANWHPESDHDSPQKAAIRAAHLNGSTPLTNHDGEDSQYQALLTWATEAYSQLQAGVHLMPLALLAQWEGVRATIENTPVEVRP